MYKFIVFLITAAVFQMGLIEMKLSGGLLCGWGLTLTPLWIVILIVIYNVYQDIMTYKKSACGEN